MKQTVYILTILISIILEGCHNPKEYNCVITETQGRYIHFSLDDVQECMKKLSKPYYETIFQEPTLHILKEWHERYGIVVSLFVQGDFTINSKYALEIIENSNWLKWGFHGDTPSPQKTNMQLFYQQVADSIGSEEIIDKSPRIHYFRANYNTCMILKQYGCIGFLTCDDWSWNAEKRESNYYLSNRQNETLDKNNRLYDCENNIHFIKTDFRLEHIIQRFGSVNKALEYYSGDQGKELIIFSHEWNFMEFLEQADSIFNWAKTEGYDFDFPANRRPIP